MQNLDSKKIDGLLKQVENAAKGAIRALNEMTGGDFKESPYEKEPLAHVGTIVSFLQRASAQAKIDAKYAGMDEEQISAAQEAERLAETENLQKTVQDKIAKRQEKIDEAKAAAEALKAEEAEKPDADAVETSDQP